MRDAVLLLLFSMCTGQWSAPKRGSARQIRVTSPRDVHPVAQLAGLDPAAHHAAPEADVDDSALAGEGGTGGQDGSQTVAQEAAIVYGLEFIEPRDGDIVSSTPFRVAMRTTGGFLVPEDGEIRLTMIYPGRGQDVRVLQSTEFQSWNIVGGDFSITAMLVSTKDEPMSSPTTVHVKQERGAHFVLMQPLDGQLMLSRTAVPVVVLFGGIVPPGSRACFEVSSAPPKGPNAALPHNVRVCTDDADAVLKEEQGGLRVEIPIPAGNCTLRAAVYDADNQPLSPESVRYFRIVEEQQECPPGSGLACLHGECQQEQCVCDSSNFAGKRCAPTSTDTSIAPAISKLKISSDSSRSASALGDAYLHLVKAALLDSLYSKDRPGETQVVARSMVGAQGLNDLHAFVEVVLDDGVEGDFMETGVWQGLLQCVAVSCSGLQWVEVGCSGLQCVAMCCSVLQCVA